MKKLIWVAVIVALAGGLAWQFRMLIFAAIAQPQMLTAPSFDSEPPDVPALQSEFNVLALSKTNSYRHASIPDAVAMLKGIAAEQSWGFFHTENAAVFNTADLQKFDLVVLASSSGTIFTADQQAAFIEFVKAGGGVVAMHAAGGDAAYEWDWYVSELICAQFVDHPMRSHIQEATLMVEDRTHPATRHLNERWIRSDEWYNFAENPRERVNVLLTIDEASYDPEKSPMGADHPMVWWKQIGEGRVLYSALGHTSESYAEPDHRALITGAMRWTGRNLPRPSLM